MKENKSLTAAEFAAIKPLLKISPERIDMAYQVLVEGQGFSEVGRVYATDRRNVFKTVNVVLATYDKYKKGLDDATALIRGVRE
jgi:hypothetical protein